MIKLAPIVVLVFIFTVMMMIPIMIFSGDSVTAASSTGIFYGAELHGYTFVFGQSSQYQFPFMPEGEIRISSGFGHRYLNGKREYHNALDFPLATGTPILASDEATVEFAGRKGGYGTLVILKHDEIYSTRYAHLSKLAITKGEKVKRGQVIAYSGNTGRSTGPHLHYEVRQKGVAVDPARFISLRPEIPTYSKKDFRYRDFTVERIRSSLLEEEKHLASVLINESKKGDIDPLIVVAITNNLDQIKTEGQLKQLIAKIRSNLDQCPGTVNPFMWLNRLQEKDNWWMKVLKDYEKLKGE